MFMLKADVSFDWTSSDDSFPIDIMIFDMIFYKKRLKSDHVCLFYVPLPQWRNCSQVARIKSTVVLEEIHEEEPTGNGCSNVNGSEEENSEYHIADEEKPSIATAGFEDHSE
ncbi:hypothetical protein AAG906_006594 [Vitis piasezkii]